MAFDFLRTIGSAARAIRPSPLGVDEDEEPPVFRGPLAGPLQKLQARTSGALTPPWAMQAGGMSDEDRGAPAFRGPLAAPVEKLQARARGALTPGWNPDAPGPTINSPRPISREPISTAPGVNTSRMPMPESSEIPGFPGGLPEMEGNGPAGPKGRAGEYGEARDVYLQGTPRGFKGRLLSGLKAGLAGRGFLSGALDPRGERNAEFQSQIMPEIANRWSLEDQDRAREAEAAQAAREAAFKRLQGMNIESEMAARAAGQRREDEKLQRPQFKSLPDGQGLYNENDPTGGFLKNPYYQAKPLPPAWKETSQGYVDLNAPENKGKVFKGAPSKRAAGGGSGATGPGRMKPAQLNAMRKDIADFEKLKAAATAAGTSGSYDEAATLTTQMNAAADRIASLYGDAVEVGGLGPNESPYVKVMGGGARPAAQANRPSAAAPAGSKVVTQADILDAMVLPENKGKNKQQVEDAFRAKGWQVQ